VRPDCYRAGESAGSIFSKRPAFDKPGGGRFRRKISGLLVYPWTTVKGYSSALTMSSTTFFASPKTIMVLSM
jgi:hypothetical protein